MKKVALVTGAADGIGLAIAERLARENYRVILVDLNADKVTRAAASLSAEGGDAEALALDVTDAGAIADAISRLDRVDVLVNNAGLQHVAKIEEFPVDKWQLLVNVMLVGPAQLAHHCIPLMRKHNFGRIINIGSIHSLVASPYKSAYVAAKHGLIGFAKTIALETADQDITINTICPAYVKTPLVENQIKNQAEIRGISEQEVVDSVMLAPMPKKSFISTDEIADTVCYLVSDAARNMTGQTLVLDGGWTAQ